MGTIRRDQLKTAATFVIGFVVLAAMAVFSGDIFSYLVLVLFAGLAWWSWPGRRGRHIAHAQAQAGLGADDAVVYWRPG